MLWVLGWPEETTTDPDWPLRRILGRTVAGLSAIACNLTRNPFSSAGSILSQSEWRKSQLKRASETFLSVAALSTQWHLLR
jgi:hypothetical protein